MDLISERMTSSAIKMTTSEYSQKRILYVASKESDYLQDLTYHGLRQLTCHIQVYPSNWGYVLPRRKYPRNLGYSNLDLMDLTRTCISSINPSIDWQKIDYVIVAAAKPDVFRTYLSLQKQIPASVPVVFLDGGDYVQLGGDLLRLKSWDLWTESQKQRPFDVIFKREFQFPALENELKAGHKVYPLPFSLRTELVSPQQKKYDVTFWAVESDPIRTRALGMLEDRYDCRQNGTVRNQIFKKYKRKGLRYLEELSAGRITLNFRGVGWDTLRYWEVFSVGGFMISGRPQIEIPENFEHGKEVIFCKDDLGDLIDLCDYYLKNEAEREVIAKAGQKKALEHHTTVARAKYIFKTLGDL